VKSKSFSFNHGDKDFEVKRGERIAQLVLERCETPDVEEIGLLEETERGAVDLVLLAPK
jgi:dUTP pyrophosphatase